MKSLVTLGAVHTHTHTHTECWLKNDFCFLTCKVHFAGVDFCTQNLIKFIGKLAF